MRQSGSKYPALDRLLYADCPASREAVEEIEEHDIGCPVCGEPAERHRPEERQVVRQSGKPRLLDLFCGAGGAAMGYHRAGFEVVGVDIKPQPNYPFEFEQADALSLLHTFVHVHFDAIHASPPCQAFTDLKVMWNARLHEDLLTPTRELLEQTGLPYVIENVEGAPLRQPVRVCGSSVGLGTDTHELRRHRLFETNWPCMVPPCAHSGRPTLGVYGDHARDRRRATSVENGQFRAAEGLAMAREAFEMPWGNWRELSQAIPPAYTELIGHPLMQHLEAKAAA